MNKQNTPDSQSVSRAREVRDFFFLMYKRCDVVDV